MAAKSLYSLLAFAHVVVLCACTDLEERSRSSGKSGSDADDNDNEKSADDDDPDAEGTGEAGSEEGTAEGTEVAGEDDPETEGEEFKEFAIQYPEFLYRAAFKRAANKTTDVEVKVRVSDNTFELHERATEVSRSTNSTTTAKIQSIAVFTRATREEVEAAGVTYSAALIFAKAVTYTDIKATPKVVTKFTVSKPFPAAVFPGPKSRYEALKESGLSWETDLTFSEGSPPVQKNLHLVITPAVAEDGDNTVVTLTTSPDDVTQAQESPWVKLNLAKVQKTVVDGVKRVISSVTYTRFTASLEPEVHQLCERINGNIAEKFSCPDPFQ